MTIVVARVDDRLVHGQVVIGWGKPLQIDRIALVDEEVAASDFEQDLYRLAAPPGIDVEFLDPGAAPDRVAALATSPERVMVLTGTVAVMTALARASGLRAINLGGVHDRPGRHEFLRYLYLDEAEYQDLAGLAADGVRITAQDLPTSAPISFGDLR